MISYQGPGSNKSEKRDWRNEEEDKARGEESRMKFSEENYVRKRSASQKFASSFEFQTEVKSLLGNLLRIQAVKFS